MVAWAMVAVLFRNKYGIGHSREVDEEERIVYYRNMSIGEFECGGIVMQMITGIIHEIASQKTFRG